MAEQQHDPDDIESEIERTRAELAETIDAIAEKVSPKRAVARTADKVKMAMKGDTRARLHVGIPELGRSVTMVARGQTSEEHTSAAGSPGPTHGRTAADKHEAHARTTGLSGGTSGSRIYGVERRLRIDRVLVAAGAALLIVTIVALARRGGKDEFAWHYEDFEDWDG